MSAQLKEDLRLESEEGEREKGIKRKGKKWKMKKGVK